MRKTINQIELVLYEINKKIDTLLTNTVTEEGILIGDITQLLIQNRTLSKETNDILVQRALKV
jgi:hypothetical protein